MGIAVRRLAASDVEAMQALNALFAEAFEDPDSYLGNPSPPDHIERQLAKPHIIALVAEQDGRMVGGLIGYVLDKLEQARSEIYIYDLAVIESLRRQGVATALIEALQPIARSAGAWVIYVQADYVDPPAIALYAKLGTREDVLHFDIPVRTAAIPADAR